jgi:hypothetical protein
MAGTLGETLPLRFRHHTGISPLQNHGFTSQRYAFLRTSPVFNKHV